MQAISDNSEPSGSYDVKEYNDGGFAQVEFKYDANGNLISDLDRKIDTIRYNLLNLPDTIQFENGNQIVNTYDASGRKLKTQYFTVREPSIVALGEVLNLTYVRNVVDESGTVYDGQFEYPYIKGEKNLLGAPRRYRVHHAEGYVNRLEIRRPALTATNTYNYYRRDHLGNNCAVWDATNDTTLQQTVYYASGLPMAVSSGQSAQPYKYNGKEFIEMHGYDTYDYGFRGYYPAVGRFTTIDPLAEKYYGISPYVYCAGNSVNYIDSDGRKIKNSKKMVLSNKTLVKKIKVFDKAVAKRSGKSVNSYTFVVTGGDRYKKDGKIYSATNNEEIKQSAKKSTHLQENGATGVDLSLAEGISYETLVQAASDAGMRIDPSGKYDDNHFHLDIKGNKEDMEYENNDYIPSDSEFSDSESNEDVNKNESKNKTTNSIDQKWHELIKNIRDIEQAVEKIKKIAQGNQIN